MIDYKLTEFIDNYYHRNPKFYNNNYMKNHYKLSFKGRENLMRSMPKQ